MEELYAGIGAAVINDSMLKKALEDSSQGEEQKRIMMEEAYENTLILTLEFKHILQLENLSKFTALRELRLNNNMIEEINGVENLKALQLLDLSFNNIKVINNIHALKQLKELSLFNNCISTIQNLHDLRQLNFLSIGNNQIEHHDDVIYLRKVEQLRSLVLKGNPISRKPNYKQLVLAHLPTLRYLDYDVIMQQEIDDATTIYKKELAVLEKVEESQRKEAEAAARLKEEGFQHQTTFVDELVGEEVFASLFKKDSIGPVLRKLEGAEEVYQQYECRLGNLCQDLFSLGVEEDKKRQTEIKMFRVCLQRTKRNNIEEGKRLMEDFVEYKSETILFEEAEEMNPEEMEQVVECIKRLNELWENLMKQEVILMDQIQDLINRFDKNIRERVQSHISKIQQHFSSIRDLELESHDKITILARKTMESLEAKNRSIDLDNELLQLFESREKLFTSLSSSSDAHLKVIEKKQVNMLSRINDWLCDYLQSLHRVEERERSRNRVLEINHFIDTQREELDAVSQN